MTPTGSKSFAAVARDPRGKQVWHTIGSAELYKIEDARELARLAIKAIKAGEDRSGPQSFDVVAEEWFKRHVEGKGLRSASHTRLYLNRHILPAWAGREFTSIRRGDVTALLDSVEDTSAARLLPTRCLRIISSIMSWYATRHDDYSARRSLRACADRIRRSAHGPGYSLTTSCGSSGKLPRLTGHSVPSFGCYC